MNPHKIVWCLPAILILVFSASEIFAEQWPGSGKSPTFINTNPQEAGISRAYFKGYIRDTGYVLRSPTKWKKNDWIKASVAAAVTVGLFGLDDKIYDSVQKNRNKFTEDIASAAERLGNGYYIIPGLGVMYAYGRLFNDNKIRRTALLSLECFVITGLLNNAVKHIAHRHRPDSGDDSHNWDGPFKLSADHLSFSSGHTATAFAVATSIAHIYSDSRFIPWIAYTGAGLTALSRIHDDKHWASDLFFGSVLGYYVSKTIIQNHNNNGKESGFSITPILKNNSFSVSVTLEF